MKNPRSTGPPQLEAKPLQRLLSDANSLQLDNGNSRPDQAAELRADEVTSAELSPRAPNSEAAAKELRAPELISALLSPPAISSELGATSLSRVSLPAAVCQLASDSLLTAKVSDDSADEGTPRLLNPALESPPPKIS